MMLRKNIFLILTLSFCFVNKFYAQKETGDVVEQMGGPINTAVPFLLISPDARSGAMGDAGVASLPDINSQHWNAAKYAFIDGQSGISLTYSPWLRALVQDMNLLYLSGFYRIDERSTVAASLLFFSLGEVVFRDEYNEYGTPYRPNEYAIDISYSRKLSDNFSIAVAGRYIRSDLTNGYVSSGSSTGRAANSGAADVSLFYTRDMDLEGTLGSNLSLGLNVSNIGAKLSYSDVARKDFLPANLKIGAAYTVKIDRYNKITAMLDLNKLLVPTAPYRGNGDTILSGMNDDVGVITGAFQSFYDAPGGFKEELQELKWSLGVEYWYNDIFAIRGGYFYEHENKGNRQYFTFGAGLKFNVFVIDFSYLVPAINNTNNPLKNTLRFSLSFNFSEYMRQRRATNELN